MTTAMRKTKIVATTGPATDSAEMIEKLILAGVNVFRLNFSHGTAADHKKRVDLILRLSKQLGQNVALLADLQGPKIRVGTFEKGKVELKVGQPFVLDVQYDQPGTDKIVAVEYPMLVKDCDIGDTVLLNDGLIQLKVTDKDEQSLTTEVVVGGVLSDRKGINKAGGGLSAPALTDKDKEDIKTIGGLNIDYVAVSFPKNAGDMIEARKLLKEAGSKAYLVAKVERAEAVDQDEVLSGIINASDAAMVARGDLGVEVGDPALIGIQKKIIKMARRQNRLVIVATQMMESMINNPTPTRAEVFDVANAVLDGTDAVMLSAETAMGEHPISVIKSMASICKGAERHLENKRINHKAEAYFHRSDESIAMAAIFAANNYIGIKAIVCLTESGYTPLLMSRIRSALPIFALTRQDKTLKRMALCRNVTSIKFDPTDYDYSKVNGAAIELLKAQNHLKGGDKIILTKGAKLGVKGQTNAMIIIQVKD